MNIDSLSIEITNFIPFMFLYAELHYRFKWLGSLYYKKEPEILADVPYRIEPDNKIPILLFIKDAHIFPIKLSHVSIHIYQSDKQIYFEDINYNCDLMSRWWNNTIYINSQNILGPITLKILINYSLNGIKKQCITHNFPQSNNHTLSCYVSKYHYPSDNKVQYGDLHYHSNLTEDMVEYGAPLRETLIAAQSMGLNFYCNTDHSYDLDDKEGSWTETDPELSKWKKSRQDIKNINNEKVFTSFIIPSEELSLHNNKGNNVHALILNNSIFLPGSGDGSEKLFNFKSEYNINNIQFNLEDNAICIAAHPYNPVPLLQRIFFKRGQWNRQDVLVDHLSGLQIVNGEMEAGFYEGIKIWIKLLLQGVKKYIYAGNDAHGNFNIYRQIKIPMLSLFEKDNQIFGKYRTGVFVDKTSDILSTIKALKKGNCFVTNGPFLNLNIEVSDIIYKMGNKIPANKGKINLHIISTPEFGLIKEINIYKGIIGENNEQKYITIYNPIKYEIKETYDVYTEIHCYFRCEVKIDSKNEKIFALSNPIWLAPPTTPC